jgi:hypothetical protein
MPQGLRPEACERLHATQPRGLGILHFAGLNRSLNFMLVTKRGKEAALADVYLTVE